MVIRTLPNEEAKKHKKYSHTNPPYLSEAAAVYLREKGVMHLLIDLPSVDREHDEGKLLAHKAFWNVNDVKNVYTNDQDCITKFVTPFEELVNPPLYLKDENFLLFQLICPCVLYIFELLLYLSDPVTFEQLLYLHQNLKDGSQMHV